MEIKGEIDDESDVELTRDGVLGLDPDSVNNGDDLV